MSEKKGYLRLTASKLGTIVDFLSSTAGVLSGILVVICSLVVFWGAFARYVLNHPTMWESRLTVYLLVSFGFLSASYGMKEGSHVRVDIFLNYLSKRPAAAFNLIGNLFVAGVSFVYCYYGMNLLSLSVKMQEMDQVVSTLPVWPSKAVMLIGMLLVGLQALRMAVSDLAWIFDEVFSESREKWGNTIFLVIAFCLLFVLGVWTLNFSHIAGLIILLVLILFSGVPVAFGLALLGTIGLYYFLGARSLVTVPNIGYANLNSFVLVALPLFIFAGQIIQNSGISKGIFQVSRVFLGRIPGGAGAATILSCAIFACISGSSVANAGTMGMIAIPHLLRLGYDRRLAFGLVAAGGTLGILIPPSAGMILFGVMTDESITKLFMSGMVPGILLMFFFMGTVILLHWMKMRREGAFLVEEKSTRQEKIAAIKEAWAGLLLPVFIIGGLYSGVFTPTEAAAVAVVYSVLVTVVSRSIKWADWPDLIKSSTKNIAMIMIIFVGAMVLGGFVTMAQIPQKLTTAIVDAQMSEGMFIATVMVFLLFMGMFMEAGAIILLVVPILYPIMQALEINIIWFAVILVINMEVACISPPVGLNLYIIQKISGARFAEVAWGSMWFVPAILLVLVLVILFPDLALWLPETIK